MGVISCYHPDVFEFISCKSDPDKPNTLERFNLSVMVDDAFMRAVEKDENIWLHWPVYDKNFDIENDRSQWKNSKEIRARDLWDQIMERAYMSGEPGVLFFDNMNRDNNVRYCERIVTTNPCAEYLSGIVLDRPEDCPITLELPDKPEDDITRTFKGVCNLGSLFLTSFLKLENYPKIGKNSDYAYQKAYEVRTPACFRFDWEALAKTVATGVEMLDSVLDINYFPHKDFANYQHNLRTIGLGITGLGDTMALLGIRYGSMESVLFASVLMNFIAAHAYRQSQRLAAEKGVFPFFVKEKYEESGFLQRRLDIQDENLRRFKVLDYNNQLVAGLRLSDALERTDATWNTFFKRLHEGFGVRNARLLSVAPTGTLSLVFGGNCSSGLEPIYQLGVLRDIHMDGQSDKDIVQASLTDWAWTKYNSLLDKHWFPDITPNSFVAVDDTTSTNQRITVQEHVDVLAAIAQSVDMSCSKTINIPTDYSFEDTKKVYMDCWKKGIKGCTIFRPNEFRQGIFNNDEKKSDNDNPVEEPVETAVQSSETSELKRGDVIQVGDDVIGRERHLKTGCGTLHFQAYFDPATGRLLETYASKGSSGGCNSFMTGASRLMSLAARGGVNTEDLVDQLLSTPPCISYCTKAKSCEVSKGTSCPAAMGYALMDMQKEINETLNWDEDEEEETLPKVVVIKDSPELREVADRVKKEGVQNCITAPVRNDVQTVTVKNTSTCPECGTELIFEGGCNICKSCGWSRCH